MLLSDALLFGKQEHFERFDFKFMLLNTLIKLNIILYIHKHKIHEMSY